MNININPIDIQIEDKPTFGFVAFLVDREDFLNDLYRLREKHKIVISKSKGSNLIKEEMITVDVTKLPRPIKTLSTIKLPDKIKVPKSIARLAHAVFSGEYYHQPTLFYVNDEIDRDVNQLRKKYKKGWKLFKVIKSALLLNVVGKEDISSTIYVIDPTEFKNPKIEIELEEYERAIIVTPDTTQDELVKAFRKLKFRRKFDPKTTWVNEMRVDELFDDKLREIVLPDTVTNIKRDRGWYWQKKSGKSYEQIRQNTLKKDQPGTWQAVRNSIARYKAHLT